MIGYVIFLLSLQTMTFYKDKNLACAVGYQNADALVYEMTYDTNDNIVFIPKKCGVPVIIDPVKPPIYSDYPIEAK